MMQQMFDHHKFTAYWLSVLVVVVNEQVFKVLWTFGHTERNRNEMYHIYPTAMNYTNQTEYEKIEIKVQWKSLPYSPLIVRSHGNIILKWLLWFKQIPEKWISRVFPRPSSFFICWLHKQNTHLTYEIKSSFVFSPPFQEKYTSVH